MTKSIGVLVGALSLLGAACTVHMDPGSSEPADDDDFVLSGRKASPGSSSGSAASGAAGRIEPETPCGEVAGKAGAGCSCGPCEEHEHWHSHWHSHGPGHDHHHDHDSGASGDVSGWPGGSGFSGDVSGWPGGSGVSGVSGSWQPSGFEFVNEGAWVARDSNPWGLQGAAYAYSDGTSVTVPETGVGYAYNQELKAYCIAGVAVEDPTYMAWGGGIGFDLNGAEEDPDGTHRGGYNWQAGGLAGFYIDYFIMGPQKVRVVFMDKMPTDGEVSPFIAARGSGPYLFSEARVPSTWDVPNRGAPVGPSVTSVLVQVVGADPGSDGPFQLCVRSFQPLLAQ